MLNKYGYWNLITLDVYRKQVGEILSIFYNIVKKNNNEKNTHIRINVARRAHN